MGDAQKQVRYFLYDHMNEEKGHEQWVINDLEAMGVEVEQVLAYKPTEFMLALNGYNYWAADRRHPCSVLGMLFEM